MKEWISKGIYRSQVEKYYRHFKGGLYRLVGIAKDSETLEDLVVYQAMYGDHQLWVRPKAMFFGQVERDGKMMDRFQEVSGPIPELDRTPRLRCGMEGGEDQ